MAIVRVIMYVHQSHYVHAHVAKNHCTPSIMLIVIIHTCVSQFMFQHLHFSPKFLQNLDRLCKYVHKIACNEMYM